jgi:hypothetical protein
MVTQPRRGRNRRCDVQEVVSTKTDVCVNAFVCLHNRMDVPRVKVATSVGEKTTTCRGIR